MTLEDPIRLRVEPYAHSFGIILCKCDGNDTRLPAERVRGVREKITDRLTSWGGGATRFRGWGQWQSDSEISIVEGVEHLVALGKDPVPEDMIREIVALVLTQLEQVCVMVAVDDEWSMYYVEPPTGMP